MGKARRVSYKKEPELHLHRYIVSVGKEKAGVWCQKYHYCVNLKEVRELRDKQGSGCLVEVYEAVHNFREAFEVK